MGLSIQRNVLTECGRALIDALVSSYHNFETFENSCLRHEKNRHPVSNDSWRIVSVMAKEKS